MATDPASTTRPVPAAYEFRVLVSWNELPALMLIVPLCSVMELATAPVKVRLLTVLFPTVCGE